MSFDNKVVLVTGGTQGIGKELVKQLLEKGAFVITNGRNEQKIASLKNELSNISNKLYVIKSDISNYEENEQLVKCALSFQNKIDILIHNASISAVGSVFQTNKNVIDKMLDVNLKGAIYLTHLALPQLIKSKGKILFVSSIASFNGLPNYSLYSLTKSAINSFSESLRNEMVSKNIHILTAYLGFTENETAKEQLDYNGEVIPINKRMKLLVTSRKKTVSRILFQLNWNIPVMTHSFLGKSLAFLNRFPTFKRQFFKIILWKK